MKIHVRGWKLNCLNDSLKSGKARTPGVEGLYSPVFLTSALFGDADVILFPDIHAGNLMYKALVHLTKCKNGCILTGTKAPVILTSRSDTFETKVNSIALAAVVAHNLKQQ